MNSGPKKTYIKNDTLSRRRLIKGESDIT